jgi:hypothetical protein
MIKKIILFALILSPVLGLAQVTISAQLPPAGFVQKDQLWNLVLVNNREDLLDVTIRMSLQEVTTGQTVLSATTGNFMMGKGVKVMTVRDVQPVLYNYNLPELSRNALPMGAYMICYQVVSNAPKASPLGDECIRINIDPLSPPLLNTPADGAELSTPYPQFTWMPPAPFEMFTNLSYDLLVTEILPGQTPVESIEYNTPVYTKNNASQPYEQYASSFTKLDTGKRYAWQVIARNGLNYAAKTEVWTFRIKNDVPVPELTNDSYVVLTSVGTNNNIYRLKQNKLNIRYYSFDKEYKAAVKLMTIDNKVLRESAQQIIYGDNFFLIELQKGLENDRLYKIELTSPNGKKQVALFSINQ